MKSLLVIFAFAGFTFNGCVSNDYVVKEGESGPKFTQDEAQCRVQVNEMMKANRNIEDDRQGTMRNVADDQGQTALPTQMANTADNNRSNRLMSNCMTSRGWTAKRAWWQFGS
jgi:hypothetical protein